jgi:phage nucleotide-binding protein
MAVQEVKIAPTLAERLGAVHPSQNVQFIKQLIYGEPGAGKTFFLGSAGQSPLTSPAIIVDIEGGTLSIRHMPGVEVVPVRSLKKAQEIINEIAMDTSDYYKTFCLDSITEMQKLDMQYIMAEQYKKKPETTDVDVPSQREWGKSSNHMRQVLRLARDLPMHVVVTALEASDYDEQTNLKNYYPSIPGKLRMEIPGFFDIVGRLEAKVGSDKAIMRQLQTAKTNRVIAKDRTSCLPPVLEHPSIPLMWELIGMDGATPQSHES